MFDILNILFNFLCEKSRRIDSELRWLLVLWKNDHHFNNKEIIFTNIYPNYKKKKQAAIVFRHKISSSVAFLG